MRGREREEAKLLSFCVLFPHMFLAYGLHGMHARRLPASQCSRAPSRAAASGGLLFDRA